MTRDERREARTACPPDGTLVALLDGALEPAPAEEVERHLEGCDACRTRMEELRNRDRAVRTWLRRHDPPPLPHDEYGLPVAGKVRLPRSAWAAAAAAVLLAAMLSGPVRAWVMDRLGGIVPGETAPAGTEPAAIPAAHALAFLSEGEELELAFTSAPTRGTLLVETAPDSLVTIRVPDGSIAISVQRGRVEIGNAAATDGLYRLEVPEGVARLRLRFPGGEPVLVQLGGSEGRTLRLDLARLVEGPR